MKVLVLCGPHPDLVAGGPQRAAYDLFEGLRALPGVAAVLLASVERTMPALFKPGAHITGFDRRTDEYLFLSHDVDPWWQKPGEPLLVQAFAEFLDLIQPDVMHVHALAPYGAELLTLTRRLLPACRIVVTFYDFAAICTAGGQMVRQTDGSLCDHASPVRCHQCFADIPPERFFLRSHSLLSHLHAADLFTTPSGFMREPFIRWGLPADRLVHVPTGLHRQAAARPAGPRARRDRFGCFGKLDDADGVWLLLAAVERLRADGFTSFGVEINGDDLHAASDARRAEIERFMAAEQARAPAERIVTFSGSVRAGGIAERMARIDWCVVPSVWWESSAEAVSQGWRCGRPVIAPDLGGPAERITHEHNGLLFDFADARALAATLRRAADEPGLWDRLVQGIEPPEPREAMARRFCALYPAATRQ